MKASLVVAGDVALHRWSEGEAPERVFGEVHSALRSADLRVVNLETVLTRRQTPAGGIGAFLRAEPGAMACLRYLSVDVVSAANNHALDFGGRALAESRDRLLESGIACCGLDDRTDVEGVSGAFRKTVNGVTIGMMAATDHYGGSPDRDGPAPVWVDRDSLLADVALLRAGCDVVVVQLHWGYEWVVHPLRWHRDLARRLVEAGADLVCCHHAHVVMGVEAWDRGVIAHGLGNFYFGTGRRSHPLKPFGMALQVGVDRAGVVSAEVIPVRTDDGGVVRVEDQAGPGFRRQCRRLADDRFLDAVERGRILYELAVMADDLGRRLLAGDVEGLLERQAYLRAPRSRWLLERAVQLKPAKAREVGRWLDRFAGLDERAVRGLELEALPQLGRWTRRRDSRLMPGRWP